MSHRFGSRVDRGLLAALVAAVAIVMLACHRSPAPPLIPAPLLPQPQISEPPAMRAMPQSALSGPDTAAELRVDIDTHGTDVDVRQVLAFLADKGKLKLVFSPGINKKVRLQLHDVPVSVALQATLAAADLTLESTNGATNLGPSSSVVFYELPVNVDSLSVDAIMKRFGVGREVAELIVQARPSRP